MTVISNLRDGIGQPIGGLGDGELQWHSDQSYMQQPATGAALYALELPPSGGETFWVDLRAAYAGLPRPLRAKIAGKRGIFDYAKRLAGYGRETDQEISEEAKRLTPPVTHALVRAHPETGDHSLYLDSTTTVGIDTWTRPRALRCSTRFTKAPPATNSSTRITGRSATCAVGQRLHDAPAHALRSKRQAADEADDDAPRPLPPRNPHRQARPIRGRNADLKGRSVPTCPTLVGAGIAPLSYDLRYRS